jgi:hypothetical protein
MAEDTPDAQASYVVTINTDGSITTQAVTVGVARKATTYDIYQTSKQLSSEIEELLLADRIAKHLLAAMQPTDPAEEQRKKIAEALSERGIDPSQA